MFRCSCRTQLLQTTQFCRDMASFNDSFCQGDVPAIESATGFLFGACRDRVCLQWAVINAIPTVTRLLVSSQPESKHCANCGARLGGRWCSQCGQKVLTERDRRFGHVLGQFAHELLHVEGKLVRTLIALVFRPGLPSAAYLNGQRVTYLSPIGLFLLVNLLYFIAPPMTDFNLDLYEQYYMQPYSSLIQPLVDARVERRETSFTEYAESYERINLNLARSLIILHLPMLALALKLLLFKRQLFYAEHFIVATHLFTFLLLVTLLMYPLGLLIIRAGNAAFGIDFMSVFRIIWGSMPALIFAHWLLSLRRCYRLGWIRAVLLTLALFFVLVVSHFVFRLVQFLAVFLAT